MFSVQPLPSHPQGENVAEMSRAICLYDNAGEHFLPGAHNANSPGTRHLAVAKALLFVFDLTQDPKVRRLCHGKSDDPQVNDDVSSYRQDLILTEATRRIRAETGLPPGQRDKRPLLVVLTKYDAWGTIANGKPLNREWILQELPGGVNQFNVRQLKAISASFRNLLLKLTPEIVTSAESFFEDVTYIPVSALGSSPQEMSGTRSKNGSSRLALGIRPGEISPVWAEVPLLYAIQRTIPGLIAQTPGS